MSKTALIHAKIYDGIEFHQDKALLVNGDQIVGFTTQSSIPSDFQQQRLNGGVLAPGFIDLQVNGGGGVLFNNSSNLEGLNKITSAHLQRGTTSIMPTVLSDKSEVLANSVKAVQQAIHSNPCILGLHIEGPFFNPNRRGAHKAEYIRKPKDEDIQYLASLNQFPVMHTFAPEQFKNYQIQALHHAGIKLLAGHSNASHDILEAAVDNGLSGFTHLYNAMGAATARQPDMVGSALSLDETAASIIVDGHHVDPNMVTIAYRCKPKGKLFLVSDSMASVGGSPQFQLYGETLKEEGGRIVNQEGTLAGSAISLIDALRIAVKDCQIPLGDAISMATYYPAQFLGVENRVGLLKTGYRADLVHFDEEFQIKNIWKSGSIV